MRTWLKNQQEFPFTFQDRRAERHKVPWPRKPSRKNWQQTAGSPNSCLQDFQVQLYLVWCISGKTAIVWFDMVLPWTWTSEPWTSLTMNMNKSYHEHEPWTSKKLPIRAFCCHKHSRDNCLLKDCTLTRLYSSAHASDIHMGPRCWPLNISFQDMLAYILSHTEMSSICTFLFYKCSSVFYLYINFSTFHWLVRTKKSVSDFYRRASHLFPPLTQKDTWGQKPLPHDLWMHSRKELLQVILQN